MAFFFYVPAYPLFLEPLPWQTEGQWYVSDALGGQVKAMLLLKYLRAPDYIKYYMLPNLQAQYPDTHIVETNDRPDLVERIKDPAATEQSGADAILAQTREGVSYRIGVEVLIGRIVQSGPGYQLGVWWAAMSGFETKEDLFKETERLYTTLMPTVMVNPQWLTRELNAMQSRWNTLQGYYQRVAEMQNRVFLDSGSGWEQRLIDALGGTMEVRNTQNPEETYDVPIGPDMNYWWVKGNELVATKTPDSPGIGYNPAEEVKP